MPNDEPMQRLGEEARIIIPSQLIGAAEAAEILGLERSTLTRWIQRERIKPLTQLDGKRGAYVFDRADVVSISQGSQAA
jgi:predicted site-specific integrase-resolvase